MRKEKKEKTRKIGKKVNGGKPSPRPQTQGKIDVPAKPLMFSTHGTKMLQTLNLMIKYRQRD